MKIWTKILIVVLAIATLNIVALTGVAITRLTAELYDETQQKLELALTGFTGDVDYLRNCGYDIDITVFEGPERIDSSIKGSIGTTASQQVIDTVLEGGQPLFLKSVDVNGEDYCGFYFKVSGTNKMLFAGIPQTDMKEAQAELFKNLMFVILLLIPVTILAALLAARLITAKLVPATSGVKEIAVGNLTARLPVVNENSKDESHVIVLEMSRLKNNLTSMITDIKTQSDVLKIKTTDSNDAIADVNETVENITLAIDEIAQSTSAIADEAVTMAGSISDMSTAVDVTNENVTMLDNCVDKMNKLASNVAQLVTLTAKLTEETNSSIELVSVKTEETNEAVESIKNAIAMIQDIADQTELLSLNASIEAAHAGDAGRGFAVVANEIRSLADSSAEGATNIEHIIKDLLRKSTEALTQMHEVITRSIEQRDNLEKVQNVFVSLQDAITAVATSADSIKQQVIVLNNTKVVVANMIDGLSAASEETAASVQETSASLQTLNANMGIISQEINDTATVSNELTSIVGQFRL